MTDATVVALSKADPASPLESASTERKHCPGHSKRPPHGPCRQGRGFGTDHPGVGLCKWHGGGGANGLRNAQKVAAAAALAEFGVPKAMDPAQALLELVWEAAGNVAFLRGRVQAMVTEDPGRAGLIGDILSLSREGEPVAVSEETRALVKLYGEWTDRLEKYASAAVKAGVSQRIVDLVERQVDVMEAVIEHVLTGLNLSPEQYTRGRELVVEGLTTVVPTVLSAQRN